MKLAIRTIAVLMILILFSCVSKFNIPQGESLNRFRYVVITQLKYSDGSIDQYGLTIKLGQLLAQEGITVLTNEKYQRLSSFEKGQVLFCNIRHQNISPAYPQVWIDFFDVFERKVYSGEAKYGLTFDFQTNLNQALNNAFKGFAEKYSHFESALAKDPAKEIQASFKEWEKIDLNTVELKEYLSQNLDNLNLVEGIWSEFNQMQYKIGIIRDENSTERDYVAFILESNTPFWIPGQVKIEFEETAYMGVYSTTYYMNDHSRQGATSIITKEGLLEIALKNSDGSDLKTIFIKNYPKSIPPDLVGGKDVSPSESISIGSGFLLTQSGLLATNYHIVNGKEDIHAVFPRIDKKLKAKIMLMDKTNDITILQLENFNFSKIFSTDIPYTVISSSSVKLGESVYTLGYPLGDVLGKSAKFSTGEISSLYGIQDDPRLYQISNPIQPGNSGGPLINRRGEIIGIVVASLNARYLFEKENILPQNVNFAIKSNYLKNLISMLPEGFKVINRSSLISRKTIENQVRMIIPFIVKIEAK